MNAVGKSLKRFLTVTFDPAIDGVAPILGHRTKAVLIRTDDLDVTQSATIQFPALFIPLFRVNRSGRRSVRFRLSTWHRWTGTTGGTAAPLRLSRRYVPRCVDVPKPAPPPPRAPSRDITPATCLHSSQHDLRLQCRDRLCGLIHEYAQVT